MLLEVYQKPTQTNQTLWETMFSSFASAAFIIYAADDAVECALLVKGLICLFYLYNHLCLYREEIWK